jgi:hypothetical protein
VNPLTYHRSDAATGARAPSRHFKNQSCCCLGSAFEVTAFQTLQRLFGWARAYAPQALTSDCPSAPPTQTAPPTTGADDDTQLPPPAFFGEGKAYPEIPLHVPRSEHLAAARAAAAEEAERAHVDEIAQAVKAREPTDAEVQKGCGSRPLGSQPRALAPPPHCS